MNFKVFVPFILLGLNPSESLPSSLFSPLIQISLVIGMVINLSIFSFSPCWSNIWLIFQRPLVGSIDCCIGFIHCLWKFLIGDWNVDGAGCFGDIMMSERPPCTLGNGSEWVPVLGGSGWLGYNGTVGALVIVELSPGTLGSGQGWVSFLGGNDCLVYIGNLGDGISLLFKIFPMVQKPCCNCRYLPC